MRGELMDDVFAPEPTGYERDQAEIRALKQSVASLIDVNIAIRADLIGLELRHDQLVRAVDKMADIAAKQTNALGRITELLGGNAPPEIQV